MALLFRAFILVALLSTLALADGEKRKEESVGGDKNEEAKPAPGNETATVDPEKLRNTGKDYIFPLFCGLAGLPIFGIVIAAAVYQPFHQRRREEKKRLEDAMERKKRSDSATEKFRLLQQQISITQPPRSEKHMSESEKFIAQSKV